ncbi:MAG: mechanosensitive ion channel family protein [Rhodobacteraceae bacterium]|jgi:small-conductance mechanosensitive channel|uniref:Small-conductance mechanosensitive channel n=1 Tax=Salipiger profundus TaxID=1229727 RepID=A0A1U7D9P6_9RHOB|nr:MULTISPECIES: mechanosensitive ion channel family protein [Salipiger]APX24785.1 small-conductance mechanosensitive channel [Salipiger profundus]MAB07703.1 mechanosensitive ion channel family protein [Paracoccaceae bacterium]GFZ97810.1 mechanosensitive ion channel protein MscS [Salipiger profundus]SFC99333.1 Small-conductance mechanosensitive channel [Salipiger profundus]
MEEELELLETQVEEITSGIEEFVPILPDWAMPVLVLALAFIVGLAIFRLVFGILNRMVAKRDLFWRSLVARTRRPLRLGLVVAALSIGVAVAPLSFEGRDLAQHGLLIAFMVLVAWALHTALHIWTTVHLRKFTLDAEDNFLARKHVTQSRILVRLAGWLIVILTVSAILMTFDGVRQWGVSLLAAGGAAGIVVGFAFQPVLKNLIAGIQLAVTQPIRIDDAVIVEGEWGWVEEITGTYVVIKVWDWRRLVVPLSYFIEQPFQNWTRDSSSLIGGVLLYLDHCADIKRLRTKTEEICRASKLWDGNVCHVQVNEFRERVMEVRILASARNAPRTYDLRCEIREEIITWIQREMPEALPRTRETVSVDGAGVAPQHGIGVVGR